MWQLEEVGEENLGGGEGRGGEGRGEELGIQVVGSNPSLTHHPWPCYILMYNY